MEKMLMQMLKAMGFDPEKLEAFMVWAASEIKSFGSAIVRIENGQTNIIARLDEIEKRMQRNDGYDNAKCASRHDNGAHISDNDNVGGCAKS